jgi:osmotically inducible protein OsmC
MSESLYKTRVTVQAGRAGHAKSNDGLLDIQLGLPKSLGGSETATNPEQLFGAGYAACFGGAMFNSAKQHGVELKDVTVDADVELLKHDTKFTIKVDLHIHTPGIDADMAQKIIDKAHEICPYSNALRGDAEVTIHRA